MTERITGALCRSGAEALGLLHSVCLSFPGSPWGADGHGYAWYARFKGRLCKPCAPEGAGRVGPARRSPLMRSCKLRQESPPLWEFLMKGGAREGDSKGGGLGGGRAGTGLHR